MYYALGIILLVLYVSVLIMDRNTPKLDYHIYCNSVDKFEQGGDPYVDEVDMYPYRYPPITLYFFKMLCYVNPDIVWVILLLVMFFMFSRVKGFDGFLFLVLLTAFDAVERNFGWGNIGIVEMFIFSFAVLFLMKKQYHVSAICIGIMAIFKNIPLLYLGLFILADRSIMERISIIWSGVMSFGILHMVSALLVPSLTYSYYHHLWVEYPVLDSVSFYNPSSQNVLRYLTDHYMWIWIPYVIVIVVSYFYISKGWTFRDKFCLGIIGILCVIPELKIHSLVVAIIPLYLLIKDMGYDKRLFYVALTCFLPLIALAIFHSNPVYEESFFWMVSLGYTMIYILVVMFYSFINKNQNSPI